MEKLSFGTTKQGEEASLYVLQNSRHTTVKVSDYGAVLVSFLFQDKDGNTRDVVLGYDDVKDYQENNSFFGATVGRNCNRIAGSQVVIGGKTWKLPANENGNNLHSGPNGFHSVIWEVKAVEQNSITLAHLSKQEEQGFPGNLRAEVTYTITEEDALEITYFGAADAETVMNFTNHSYFNLGGHDSGTIAEQSLQILADYYTPVDAASIPTGEIAPVQGTPMDFKAYKPIGRDLGADFEQLKLTGGFDHNYVLTDRPGELRIMANAYCSRTGIALEASTDCCGVQLYTGNFIGDQTGKGGAGYGNHSGFCLESQFYPNAANQENFPSPIVKGGTVYTSRTVYRLFLK